MKTIVLIASLLICVTYVNSQTADNISQYGITWKFDTTYTYGQFANGDYWVVGPVTITSITPASVNINGRVMNGSMINPVPTVPFDSAWYQGYDSHADITNRIPYNAASNVGMNLPLTIQPGSSLLSSISNIQAGAYGLMLKQIDILTVLSAAPPEGSFRPAYCGKDKTIRFNKNNLDTSKLGKLQPVGEIPTFSALEAQFQLPFVNYFADWVGNDIMNPSDHTSFYGRTYAASIGDATLLLNCNYSNTDKQKLLAEVVQFGVDIYGIIKEGGVKHFLASGGHSSGRLWSILFAGIVLNNQEMMNVAQKSGAYAYTNGHDVTNLPLDYVHFGEIESCFYVTQADVDRTHNSQIWTLDSSRYERYEITDIGLPEWGGSHAGTLYGSEIVYVCEETKTWTTDHPYRLCCTANTWEGQILSSLIMDTKSLWNNNAFFDYMDRYLIIETTDWMRFYSNFVRDMWTRYRADYGCVYVGIDTLTHKRQYDCSQCKYNCTAPVTKVDPMIIPKEFSVSQNYPNPFNPSTKIEFIVSTKENIKLVIYDLLGRQIRTLVDGIVAAGIQSVSWDGRDTQGKAVSSGVYFYSVEQRGQRIAKQMVLIK